MKIILSVVILIVIVGGIYAVKFYNDNLTSAEYVFTIEYLDKADIMSLRVESLQCFSEWESQGGIKKYSCVVGRRIK